ncbi:uncharacterized protein [Rutidosis leptorrhynchoides]|uniref:uncharacterized protein n=1 Tax=Rutidosis leptorrhynchoides TaxID=125765 RepID=UPI003A997748
MQNAHMLGRSRKKKNSGSTDIVLQTTEKIDKIRERLKMAQDRQKSYADKRRRPIEFEVGDKVMLKVSPWKVAYKLLLPEELNNIHDTFHVSQLRKCLADETTYVPLSEIVVNEKLKHFEEPIKVVDYQVKQLRNKSVTLLKVQWKYQKGSEFTWEPEEWLMVYCPSVYQEWFVRTRTAQGGEM